MTDAVVPHMSSKGKRPKFRSSGVPIFIILAIAASFSAMEASARNLSRDGDGGSFMREMVGDWIGTFDQSTDRVKAPTKYFHASVTQTGPDSYETLFKYYKLDPLTLKAVDAGTSRMETNIVPDGTARNKMIGGGDVLIDAETLKSEQHEFNEVLQAASPNVLQGLGTGTIRLRDPSSRGGKDKKGKIVKGVSTWSMDEGVLRITLKFEVRFKVLFFARTYQITMDHNVKRGSDIMGLIRDSAGNAIPATPAQ